jgi:UDP-N-acetylglucosamine 2-epimerase (non-hydrolysing)
MKKMSKIFFNDLELPQPDFYLGVGSGSHAEQTAKIMIEFEKVLLSEKPDLVIVVGDVNSTLACTLTASKINIETVHVEAGLRSFDRSMPEEINRLLTNAISDLLFVTEKSGLINLKNEGVSESKVFLTGNVMIDSIVNYLPKADNSNIHNVLLLEKNKYILVTLHRPNNVDTLEGLKSLLNLLNILSIKRKLIFPIHPRTKTNMINFGLDSLLSKNVIITEPVGYIDFLSLMKNAELIITDSGGIQEESTFLGIQCITVRNNTERPITVEVGTNHLVGTDLRNVEFTASNILEGKLKEGKIPELWDGKAAERISQIIVNHLS